jgi:hypothetical protein
VPVTTAPRPMPVPSSGSGSFLRWTIRLNDRGKNFKNVPRRKVKKIQQASRPGSVLCLSPGGLRAFGFVWNFDFPFRI